MGRIIMHAVDGLGLKFSKRVLGKKPAMIRMLRSVVLCLTTILRICLGRSSAKMVWSTGQADYEIEETYEKAESSEKVPWRDNYENGREYGIDAEDSDIQAEYIAALEETKGNEYG